MAMRYRFAVLHAERYSLSPIFWLRSFVECYCACFRGVAAAVLSLALSSLCWGIAVNDRVQVVNGASNVRSTAAGSVVGTQAAGSLGTVVNGPTVASLGGTSYTWWNVNWDVGFDGWVADTGLSLIPIVTSVSPTTMVANSTLQLLTIFGSNFQAFVFSKCTGF